MKISEAFEGPNSSLRKAFDEATRGNTRLPDGVTAFFGKKPTENTPPAQDWREELKQEVVGMLHPEVYRRTCSFIQNLLENTAVIKGERRRIIEQIREEERERVSARLVEMEKEFARSLRHKDEIIALLEEQKAELYEKFGKDNK